MFPASFAQGRGHSARASFPPVFDTIYTYAWFVGFGVAAVVYLVLMLVLPLGSQKRADSEVSP